MQTQIRSRYSNLRLTEKIKCLIIGSGPAGYAAAIYASRANLMPVLYEGDLSGGQLTTTSVVENFPGYPNGVVGVDMMDDFKKQAQNFGTDIRSGRATDCDLSITPYKIVIDEKQIIETDTLIICTGSSVKYLGLESEKKYIGKGVSTCAVCDGFFYRKKIVAVVGGGDSACEEALYLADLANKVYLIVRKDALRAFYVIQKKVLNHPKIEIFFNTNVTELLGDEFLKGIRLIRHDREAYEEKMEIAIDGFFVAIGHTPNTKIFKKYISTDLNGYIQTNTGTTKTNLPGVFAAGDVADPIYQQAIIASGTGCMAAIEAQKYLNEINISL